MSQRQGARCPSNELLHGCQPTPGSGSLETVQVGERTLVFEEPAVIAEARRSMQRRQRAFVVGLIGLGVVTLAALASALLGLGLTAWLGVGVLLVAAALVIFAPSPKREAERARWIMDAWQRDAARAAEPDPRWQAIARLIANIDRLADADDLGIRAPLQQSVTRLQELRQEIASAESARHELDDPTHASRHGAEASEELEALVEKLRWLHAELVSRELEAAVDPDGVDSAANALQQKASPLANLFDVPF